MSDLATDAEDTPAVRAASFARSFVGWANELALLFGGPLYLVGSSLTSLHPGDRDLRLMLDRETCETWWGKGFDGPSWEAGPAWFARKREELKQARRLTRAWNPRKPGAPRFDFQFQVTLFSEFDGLPIMRDDKPSLRLDVVPLDHFAAGRGDP